MKNAAEIRTWKKGWT